MKHLVILGSTGSIGQQALDVVRSHSTDYNVSGLGAGTDLETLVRQTDEFEPDVVGVARPEDQDELADRLRSESNLSDLPEIVAGPEGLRTLASEDTADIVLSAVSGRAGLPGSLAALRSGKRLALANKESMLIAGDRVNELLRSNDEAELIPVDSEHSSLFQLLNGTTEEEVQTLYLTASGGPFRNWSREELEEATPEDALDHPTWSMGEKITVDSATMMNKAIEVVEAYYLFQVDVDDLDVVVHPDSTVHAMVELTDGTLLTHMGPTDMKKPIQYSFTYPDRGSFGSKRLDVTDGFSLQFEAPDHELFPALNLGFRVARRGGTCGAVLNGANEVAVRSFLEEQISFPEITEIVQEVLEEHEVVDDPELEEILKAEREARQDAEKLIGAT